MEFKNEINIFITLVILAAFIISNIVGNKMDSKNLFNKFNEVLQINKQIIS